MNHEVERHPGELASLRRFKERVMGLPVWVLDDLDPNEPRMAPAEKHERGCIATYIRAADIEAIEKEVMGE